MRLRQLLFQACPQTVQAVPVDRNPCGRHKFWSIDDVREVELSARGPIDCAETLVDVECVPQVRLGRREITEHRIETTNRWPLAVATRWRKRSSLAASAGGLRHGVGEVGAVIFGHFSARDPDPDRQRNRGSTVMSLDALLYRNCAGQRTARRGKRDHESVAEIFHLGARSRDNRITNPGAC
jgi:hypothetical protein